LRPFDEEDHEKAFTPEVRDTSTRDFDWLVVLSGQASALVQPRLMQEGADAVIEKDSAYPSWQEDLLARLRMGRTKS